jgi:tetratricopeptide (TPR) repeat protein
VDDFGEVLRIDPSQGAAYYNRAAAYAALGATNQAIVDMQTAVDLYASQGDTENQERALEAIRILQAQTASGTPESGLDAPATPDSGLDTPEAPPGS